MATGVEYNNQSVMMRDLTLWLAWKKSEDLTLGQLPKIAEGRWQWIVDNWIQLKKAFLEKANGDETLLNVLTSLNNNVIGWKAGSKVNPLGDAGYFEQVIPFLTGIGISTLFLTPQEEKYIQEETKRISLFTSANFKAMLKLIRDIRDSIFDKVGLGDDFYSSMKGRNSLKRLRDSTLDDLEYVRNLVDIEHFILGIVLDFKNNTEHAPNLLAFAQSQLSEESDVAFQTAYQTYTKVPFSISLEQMAQDYLGSKSRWYELVTVNNLKPPYVDITGEKELLLETGAGISVHVNARYADRMRIGSTIKIGSKVVPEEIRRVESFTDNKDGTITLLLSGASNLNKLREDQGAYLRLFSPETIQDFTFVKIPFMAPPPASANLPEPETQALKNLDKSLYAFGVDLAINEATGDLMVSAVGDVKIRYGMSAVRQAVWNSLRTYRGQLPLHPNYGTPDNIGNSMYGGDTMVRLATIVQDSVGQDSRYTSINLTNFTAGATEATMTTNVTIAGNDTLLPFTFSV